MTLLPGVYEREYERRLILKNEHGLVRGSDVVLDKNTQSPLSPPSWIPRGLVLVRHSGSGRFVAADDPRGDRNAPASVSALVAADAAWGGNLISVEQAPGLGVVVALDPATADNAAVIDQLNQHLPFAALYLADEDQGGVVRIRTREAGADKHFTVVSSHDPAYGVDGVAGGGRDADYRVSESHADLQALGAGRIEASVATLLAGHFLDRKLLSLTPEARAVLSRRGSIFA